ncbi:MAG: SurA N-terminal domain-containing protein [Candidatus Omnitrophota bacterium]
MVLHILRSKKFAKRIMTAILILIIPAFILWGVGSLQNRPQLVGQIGKHKVYTDDIEESRLGVKVQILFSYYGNFNALNQIFQNRSMLNYMAWERLILLNKSRDKKIRINNNDVLAFLSQHPLFLRNGSFDKRTYQYILRNTIGTDPRHFEELVRQNLAVQILRGSILKNIAVSETELRDYYKQHNDKVKFSYLLIDKDLFSAQASVSEDESMNYYTANKDIFFEPEKAEIEYIEFPYANNSQTSQLKNILTRIKKSPLQFKNISRQSNLNYKNPAAFAQNEVIPDVPFFENFHKEAFTLQEGAISDPLFSPGDTGSVYILRKIKNIPRKYKTFTQVRGEIEKKLEERKSLSLAEQKANSFYEEITSSSSSLENKAREIGQTVAVSSSVTIDGYIENIGPAERFVSAALKTGQGKMLRPINIKKGILLARIEEIIPADETAFEDQKKTIEQNLLIRKQAAAMDVWIKENATQLILKTPLDKI